MRMPLSRLCALLAVLLVLGACTDTPTEPGGRPVASISNELEGCVVGGICLLPPISGGGGGDGWCDPRMGDCGDGGWGTCITTAPGTPDPGMVYTSSCPGGGGSGPGGDGGGGSGGDGSTAPPPASEPPAADTCNTGEPVVDAPDVSSQFQALWLDSRTAGVEKGGWIVSDGGSFRLVPFQNADFTACGIDIRELPPAGTVSMVHTHPWALWSATPCGYINTGTPSEEDVRALQLTGLSTGYFLDEQGIGKYTATGGEHADRIDRCGY